MLITLKYNRTRTWPRWLVLPVACCLGLAACCLDPSPSQAAPLKTLIQEVQPKIVKVYGAGGFRGLEAYQSGFLISHEGHVVTVWSYVLDTDFISVTLNDGRKFEAKLMAADPRMEIAVLKIDAVGLPHFNLDNAVDGETGTRVLALSNLYGVATGNEPASVQHGVIAVKTRLDARRGVFETPYRGPVYVLDAMTNNPGAAGGALVDYQGELLGMLGKELRNAQNNTWLNYAIPAAEMIATVEEIRGGKFIARPTDDPLPKPEHHLDLQLLGLVLVPDVLDRTPPFIDAVLPGSPAAQQDLRPDDLILFVNGRLIQSCKALHSELEYVDRVDPVKITVIRGQELIDFELRAAPE